MLNNWRLVFVKFLHGIVLHPKSPNGMHIYSSNWFCGVRALMSLKMQMCRQGQKPGINIIWIDKSTNA